MPRLVLDDLIVRRAVEAGATLWEDARSTDRLWRPAPSRASRSSATAERSASEHQWSSPLTEPRRLWKAGRYERYAAGPAGTAIRGYYTGVEGLDQLLEIDMPLLDMTDRYLLPSYGWVFPTGATEVNVGVGVFERSPGSNLRALMDRYVDSSRI